MNNDKGFDIVMGNPPYIRQEKIDDLAGGMDYKSMLGNIYGEDVKTDKNPDNKLGNTMDFSMYFIVRSRQLLRNKGYHSFIITNKWLRASYGEPIRHFLKHKVQLTKFIDFVNCNIFRGASVDTVIYMLKKTDKTVGKISYCCPTNLDDFAESDHDYYCEQRLLDDKVWSFSDPLTAKIKQYIKSVGTPLKDMGVEINSGIKTGFNDAFLIKTDTRDRLIEQDPKCDDVIKPLVKGKNINRYNIQWNDWWLIRFENGRSRELGISNEEDFKKMFPLLYSHFESFFDKSGKGKGLKERDDQGDFWWELRPCIYYEDFDKPKIMWSEISSKGDYVWVEYPLYSLNKGYLTNSLTRKYILQLNSKLVDFYFSTLTPSLGNKGTIYVERMCIIEDFDDIHSILVDYLHISRSFDNIVDFLVYELFLHFKFHEDGLYPKDEMYLLNAIKPHLQPINYEEWLDLDWKRQLDEITDEESERLTELTEQNNGIIEEAVESLENDEEVEKWMKVIKSHEWVKKIEDN